MTKGDDSAATRESILLAAQRIVAKQGAGHLTIERVAREAGLSKGAVLYHFPTKQELVRGMVGYMVESFNRLVRHLREAENDSAGAGTRAYVRACLEGPAEADQAAAGLLAAVATNPELLGMLRKHFSEWQRFIERDGIDSTRATTVRLAADGLWLFELFGFRLPNARLRKQVIEDLMRLTREE
jgi:AcrR family transcriptional regulator